MYADSSSLYDTSINQIWKGVISILMYPIVFLDVPPLRSVCAIFWFYKLWKSGCGIDLNGKPLLSYNLSKIMFWLGCKKN